MTTTRDGYPGCLRERDGWPTALNHLIYEAIFRSHLDKPPALASLGGVVAADGMAFADFVAAIVGARADHRDAEIARLKAAVKEIDDLLVAERTSRNRVMAKKVVAHEQHQKEIAAHKRALAAGPAALRAKSQVDELPGVWDLIAEAVEAAQEAALKGGG